MGAEPDDGPVVPDVAAGVVHWPMSVVVLGPVGEADHARARELFDIAYGENEEKAEN